MDKDKLKNPDFAIGASLYFVDELFKGKYNLQYRKFYNRAAFVDEETKNQLSIDGFVTGVLCQKR